MSAPSYIPTTDADFALFSANFAAIITANPTDYGLVEGDAAAITAADTAFQAAYLLATNPATRTAPTIADKDAQRASDTAIIRPYAQQIASNAALSPSLITGLGLNLPNTTRPRIPPPTTFPDFTHVSSSPLSVLLGYHDTTTPLSKAKPQGAIGMDVFRHIGTAPVTDPTLCQYRMSVSKSPFSDEFDAADQGKVVTYIGRWRTRGGVAGVANVGPYGTPISFNVI